MVRRVVYHVWDEALQDFREAPLDDADPWTLDFANQVNGRDLTNEEFDLIVALFHGVLAGG